MDKQTTDALLRTLAERYETAEFLHGDPSWWMHQVERPADKEVMAFIAACLSYGSRAQFMPKIGWLLERAEGRPHEWVLGRAFAQDIPSDDACFYRLYTRRTMSAFLHRLADMLAEYGTIGDYVYSAAPNNALDAVVSLCQWFAAQPTPVVPKTAASSCKRLCMFLRWMVRDGSPVDLGLWRFIDKRTLIVPMDTHVVQEANRLGLTSSRSTSMAAARKLTARLAEVFPDDPLRGDFALFGVGVTGHKLYDNGV